MSDEIAALSRPDDAYDALLADLRAIIASGRGRAAAAVNAEIVATYWKIGGRIVAAERQEEERAGSTYGERLIAQLGDTLSREFGRAFGRRNLYFIRQFYLAYPNVNALRTQLTWTHYRTLMRLDTEERRAFYERMAATGRWSSRELDKQINSMLYERVGLSRRPEEMAASLPHPNRPVAPLRVRRGLPRSVCARRAPFNGISYPFLREEELEGVFLGHRTNRTPKGTRESSMCGKRRTSESVVG